MEFIDTKQLKDVEELLAKAKWLEGKSLAEIMGSVKNDDRISRVLTKGEVGYVIEKGFFSIDKNSDAEPDIRHLGVEIKTNPLKFNKDRTRLSVKEPLSLNMINYIEEDKNDDIKQSSLFKKNGKMLLVLYVHDKERERSDYIIKYVFLWEMDEKVLDELRPDYEIILKKIREGKAHEIHQKDNKYLTLCPKHNGNFKDPNCKRSKRPQPHSDKPAELRAFRLKNRYMNLIISRHLNKELGKGGWKV